jgi:hypothetical protein
MIFALRFVLPWFLEGAVLVPLMGAGACGLAFLVGRRFLRSRPPLDDKAGAAFSGTFLQGTIRDRRCAIRRRGNSVEVRLFTAPDKTPLRGWVLDRSVGGLCLLVEQEVAKGSTLRVRPRNASATTPGTDIIVRSCRPRGDQYELGCQFQGTPTWSLLLMFG